MRRLAGWVLVFVGSLVSGLGAAAAIVIGPDDAVRSQSHTLTSSGVAIVSAPDAITYAGPTLSLDVTAAGGTPVFVGVGSQIDVDDLVGQVARTEVEDISVPWSVSSVQATGSAKALPGVPGLDWWLASDSGRQARVSLGLPDRPVQVVVMNADGSPSVDVDVTAELSIPGIFVGAVAAIVLGVGLGLSGWLTLARRKQPQDQPVHRRGAE